MRTRDLDYPGRVLSRNRKQDATTPTAEDAPSATAAERAGKGRPTPRRKDVEAARRRPLVPTDRKQAQKSSRQALKEQRQREYEAMLSGDERHMPYRDRGPARRFVRDTVDARRNLGEMFLPFSIVMVFAVLLTGNSLTGAMIVMAVLYLGVIATVVDAFLLARMLKRRLEAKFDEKDIPRGSRMYGVVRAFQIRRSRLPRPQVGRGEYPV